MFHLELNRRDSGTERGLNPDSLPVNPYIRPRSHDSNTSANAFGPKSPFPPTTKGIFRRSEENHISERRKDQTFRTLYSSKATLSPMVVERSRGTKTLYLTYSWNNSGYLEAEKTHLSDSRRGISVRTVSAGNSPNT